MTPRDTGIAYQLVTDLSFEDAVAGCRAALPKEGFGVLTEIDIQAKLKEKLGVDVQPNLILGACHPASAHQALQAVPEAGVLLPCNVTVSVEGGRTIIRAMNPEGAMKMLGSAELDEIAVEVGARLRRVMAALSTESEEIKK